MTREELERRVQGLKVWQRRGERAPHKPLLLLYAIGRALRGEPRLAPYDEVEGALGALLREFGPQGKSCHPEYPFWHLQTDGLWRVESDSPMALREGHSGPKKSELIAKRARGGFPPDIQRALAGSPAFAHRLANLLLESSFPETVHEDILAAVGLDLEPVPQDPDAAVPRRRDPAFRDAVLTAYERRCAVCGFDVRLGTVPLGLDAAHIKWHQAGGPDLVPNGLALCVLHHKLFDRGVFTLDDARRLVVSEHATGGRGFETHLLGFHGRPIRPPQSRRYDPADEYLAWHRREVFHGRQRDVEQARPPLTAPASGCRGRGSPARASR